MANTNNIETEIAVKQPEKSKARYAAYVKGIKDLTAKKQNEREKEQ